MTTLYFEAEREDDLRRVGYSKERRVDPQVIVGLLVDRHGFPLQVGCWEGSKAETTTIIPIVEAFQAAHGIADLIIVNGRRHALSRQPDGPGRREAAVHRLGPAPPAPQATWRPTSTGTGTPSPTGSSPGTITPRRGSKSERDKSRKSEPVWDPHTHPGSWRAVWVYFKKRAARDNQTLTAQANRARAIRRRRETSQGHQDRHHPRR